MYILGKIFGILVELIVVFCVAIVLYIAIAMISGNAEYSINCKFCDMNWTNMEDNNETV